MVSKREQRNTRKLKKHTEAILKLKLAEMILLKEDIEMQENFAADLDEKKAIIQQLTVNVTHQIQALRTVIQLFAEDGKEQMIREVFDSETSLTGGVLFF